MNDASKYSPEECTAQAIEILRKNNRTHTANGAFTVPTDKLYPHQWNWDAAFSALGWKAFDERRAWEELQTLVRAQWPNGMIPHIIYHERSATYFPDLNRWGETPSGNSSGITQNPVLASCVRWMFEAAQDVSYAKNQTINLLPKIEKWHQWFFDQRCDSKTGAIAIAHPWESRDNACDWDAPLLAVDNANINVPEFERKDLLHVDAQQRPNSLQYQQYLSIIEVCKSQNWHINANNAVFWVADPFITSILIAAEYDLAFLARKLGQQDIETRARERIVKLEGGLEYLWDDNEHAYRAYDLLTNCFATHDDIGTFLPLYGGIPASNRARADVVIDKLERWLAKVEYGVPSHDPYSSLFESQRYWRGPVWLVVNYMIVTGLRRFERDDLADKISRASNRLIRASGFCEFFDPVSGSGLGGNNFSWTAAMWLHWLKDYNPET